MTGIQDYNELGPFTVEIGFIDPTTVCNDSLVFLNSQPITDIKHTFTYTYDTEK